MKTCIITTDTYLNHNTGLGHPENADRVSSLIQNASTNDQSYILGSLKEEQAQSVIDLLKKEEQEETFFHGYD